MKCSNNLNQNLIKIKNFCSIKEDYWTAAVACNSHIGMLPVLNWTAMVAQADHNFSWTKPGHQMCTLKVYTTALKSRMTMCKMSPINPFRNLYLKLNDHSHQWRIQVLWYGEGTIGRAHPPNPKPHNVQSQTPSPRHEQRVWGRVPHTFYVKLRKETQFWVKNDAKLTKNWRQLLPAAAASAICCTNMVKNEVGWYL